jgi:inner membrane protein
VYRAGHYGVALLVYAPVGVTLAVGGRSAAAVVGGGVVLALTPLPDYDQRVPFVEHRGVTHTLLFAGLVGAGTGGAAGALTGAPALGALGFGFGALAVLAHLLADALTPAGIRPLWPLSSRSYSLALTTAANPVANYLLFALGVFATAAAVLAVPRLA